MRSMGNAPETSTRDFIEDKRAKARVNTGTKSHLTCVTFDDRVDVVFNKETKKITDEDIFHAVVSMRPRGLTRFTDTAYETLSDLMKRARKKRDEFKGEVRQLEPSITVSVAFLTDGQDNKSIRDPSELGDLIQELEDSDFKGLVMFMAANMDSVTAGNQYGIHPENCIDFSTNRDGMENVLRSASAAMERVSSGRACGFSQAERTASQVPSHGSPCSSPGGSPRLVRTYAMTPGRAGNNRLVTGDSSDEDISPTSTVSCGPPPIAPVRRGMFGGGGLY
jgi:hypothetical protein